MNKTAGLVNEWAAFEEKHPEGDIEGFCRFHLAHQRNPKDQVKGALVDVVVPSLTPGLLMKIIGRISKLNMAYKYLVSRNRLEPDRRVWYPVNDPEGKDTPKNGGYLC